MNAPSLRWGKTHEDDARKAYLEYMAATGCTVSTVQSGLVIDRRDSCLACIPDDITILPSGEQGLVDYKCPYKAGKERLTPQQAAVQYKDFCSTPDSIDEHKLVLKQTHPYYYQIQGSLDITGKQWCHFVIWTPSGISVETIERDVDFWEPSRTIIVEFYRCAILPELVVPRFPTGQAIHEPFLPTP